MRIGEIFQEKDFGLSIEIFPPKTPKGDSALIETLERLSVYRPDFVSCTYGAGGSTQERTLEWCVEIQKRFQLTATSHFTCVGSTRDELCEWLSKAQQAGITNIMALRGDPPEGEETFRTVEDGLSHANELVELIRAEFPEFGIGVAGYPEKHTEAPDMQTDLSNLKRKVDAGADAVFTQLFYVNDSFFRFRDRCEEMGITVPIVPGIMPITEFARIKRITSMCGATFPDSLASQLETVQEDKAAQFEIGVEFAIEQCRELLDRNVAGIHFYALNRSPACERILDALGIGQKETPRV
ncbi:MAG: methylenetetrahydrofolate reductase [NAD(P)H] [Planctomycetes bacterium]|nr:methylenetetrahydrofolate reductase [NAD(P)H] [Planctomycetota bacterium]